MYKKVNFCVLVIFLLISLVFVYDFGHTHSGRTDSRGGHYNRKTGGYHYHNSGKVRQQSTTRRQSVAPRQTPTKRVWVNGYYRKDGTYVRGHYRTAPDGNPYNNYSFPGNYNPNTGKITPGNPQTYLDRYYNKSNSSSLPPTSNENSTDDVYDAQTQVQAKQTIDDPKQIKTAEQQLSERTEQVQTLTTTTPNVQAQYTYTPTKQANSSDTSSAAPVVIVLFIVIAFVSYCLRQRRQT